MERLPDDLDIEPARALWAQFANVPPLEHVIQGLLSQPPGDLTPHKVQRLPVVLDGLVGCVDGRWFNLVGIRRTRGRGRKIWATICYVHPIADEDLSEFLTDG